MLIGNGFSTLCDPIEDNTKEILESILKTLLGLKSVELYRGACLAKVDQSIREVNIPRQQDLLTSTASSYTLELGATDMTKLQRWGLTSLKPVISPVVH